jgi:hypothetical protein
LNVDVSAPAITCRSPGWLPGFSLHISRPFESDIALALHGANSAKNQTQPEDAIPGNDTRVSIGSQILQAE